MKELSHTGLAAIFLRLLRVPPEPEPPRGAPESLRTFRASPKYFRFRLCLWWIGAALSLLFFGGLTVGLGVAALAAGGVARLLLILAIFLTLTLGLMSQIYSYLSLRLDYEMRWYMVTDRCLRIREGLWQVREMTMTFANIQNLSISQGPLQKLFGIADLKVTSAGGGSHMQQQSAGTFDAHTGTFRGVDAVEEIRDLILERLKHYRDAGLGDSHDKLTLPTSRDETLQALRDEAAGLRKAAERLATR